MSIPPLEMRLPPPDFVIVGAPKCGTTAAFATLQKHPQLFLPDIKEPHYFAYDFPGYRGVRTVEDYDRLFADAERKQLRGEASVSYLSSKEATAAILRRRPDAKFIALVRNPLDMFVSWHNQMYVLYEEEAADPERAWILQVERAQGLGIPKLCREPALLQYKTLCSLGAQIESLFRLVPEHQRLVIVFDDLQQHPRQTYERIVDFLGIEDDGTDRFVRENVFARPKNELIWRVLRAVNLNPGVKKLRLGLKPVWNKPGMRPVVWLLRRTFKTVAKPTLSRRFRRELQAAFAPDVQLLGRLLFRGLSKLWSLAEGAAHLETRGGGSVLSLGRTL